MLIEDNIEPETKSLTTDQITAMCQRGFGPNRHIGTIHELDGGTFNTTYLITFRDSFKVILRVSAPQGTDILWDEAFLMRREQAMQPLFAPVATRMPKTLFIDFTHQLIDRDYIFQTFIEGERWDKVMDELSATEKNILWKQFGNVMRLIHNVHGERFGLPLSGFQFDHWSQTVINRFERVLHSAKEKQIHIPHLSQILEIVHAHTEKLDEIQVPCLLHGDMWSFNLLVSHRENNPTIVGILDSDRAWWGDPMVDWTMFILAHAEKEEGYAHFWQAYGQPEETPNSMFRGKVYDTMHAGTAFTWAVTHQDQETIDRAEGTFQEVAEVFSAL